MVVGSGMSISLDEGVELLYMSFSVDGIVSLEDWQLAHTRLIWQIMWISLDVGEVARLVKVSDGFLIDGIREKKMEIKKSFLSEKIYSLSRM